MLATEEKSLAQARTSRRTSDGAVVRASYSTKCLANRSLNGLANRQQLLSVLDPSSCVSGPECPTSCLGAGPGSWRVGLRRDVRVDRRRHRGSRVRRCKLSVVCFRVIFAICSMALEGLLVDTRMACCIPVIAGVKNWRPETSPY